jgi:hypothetical protein
MTARRCRIPTWTSSGPSPGAPRAPGPSAHVPNALIHGYDEIDDEVVWDTVTVDLPTLRMEVDTLLRELDDGTP